jgi:iron(III) transport system permease protein
MNESRPDFLNLLKERIVKFMPRINHSPKRLATTSFFNVTNIVWWVIVILVGFTVIYPSLVLVIKSFVANEEVSFANYLAIFTNPAILKSMINSLIVVIPSTIISTIIAVVLAWIVARTNLPGKGIWQTLLVIPYLIPPFIGAIAWTYLLGPVGFFNKWLMNIFNTTEPLIDIYSIGGMIFVMSIYGFAIPYIIILPTMKKINASIEESARISGASTFRALKDITIPILAPAILGGMLLLFMYQMAEFGAPAVLGAPDQINLMTTQIYYTILSSDMPNHLQVAAAQSMLLVLLGIIGLNFYSKFTNSSKYVVVSGKSGSAEVTKLGKYKWVAQVFLTLVVLVTFVAPMLAVLVTSISKVYGLPVSFSNLTLNNFLKLFELSYIQRSLFNSFILSVTAGAVVAFCGLIIAYMTIRGKALGSRLINSLVAIPYAVPGTIVALAMIMTFSKPVPIVGWQLYGTFMILLVAYLARFMNLGVTTLSGAIGQIDPALEEASRISGASRARSFRDVMLPLLRPSLYSAFFLVLIPALGEISLSALLWSVGNETIGVSVFSTQMEGKVLLTAALAILLLTFTVLLNIIARVVSKGKVGI